MRNTSILISIGARMYDSDIGRWFTPDPLAEKYHSISPYAFCAGNPVNYVDWDGRDVWNIREDGRIEWVKQRKRDIVRTINDKGNVIKRLSFKNSTLSKGTLNIADKNYDYFNLLDAKSAKKLFEFVATPSNWGKDNYSNDPNVIIESAVMYTNIGNTVLLGEKGATPTAAMAMKYIDKDAIFTRIDHVHPNNESSPSGTNNKNGDIGTISFLEKRGARFSTPEWDRYHIFTPNSKQYHAYDYYTIDMIAPAIFSVKRN